MSSCSHNDRISAYHDGELPAAAARELEAHMASCPACTAELAELRELSRRFGALATARPVMSDDAIGRVHAEVDEIGRERSVLRFAEVLTALAAVLLIATSLGLLTWSPSSHANNATANAAATSAAEWETLAVSLPGDSSSPAPPMPAYEATMETAEWIVSGLSGGGGGAGGAGGEGPIRRH